MRTRDELLIDFWLSDPTATFAEATAWADGLRDRYREPRDGDFPGHPARRVRPRPVPEPAGADVGG